MSVSRITNLRLMKPITIAWDFPVGEEGLIAGNFVFRHRAIGSGTWTELSVSRTLRQHTVSLSPGSYEFQVGAKNGSGVLIPEAESAVFQADVTVSQITNLRVV